MSKHYREECQHKVEAAEIFLKLFCVDYERPCKISSKAHAYVVMKVGENIGKDQ